MKKISVSFVALIIFLFSANAQYSKGSVFLGGSLNYSSQEYENSHPTSKTSLTISPEVTFMVNKTFALGLGVGVINSIEKFQETEGYSNYDGSAYIAYYDAKTKNQIITPSIFIQKFYPISNKLYWSIKAGAGFGWGRSSYKGTSNHSEDYTAYSFGLSPELNYFFTPRIGMKANFNGMTYTHFSYKEDTSVNFFQFDLNPSTWSFGFFVKL